LRNPHPRIYGKDQRKQALSREKEGCRGGDRYLRLIQFLNRNCAEWFNPRRHLPHDKAAAVHVGFFSILAPLDSVHLRRHVPVIFQVKFAAKNRSKRIFHFSDTAKRCAGEGERRNLRVPVMPVSDRFRRSPLRSVLDTPKSTIFMVLRSERMTQSQISVNIGDTKFAGFGPRA
jgi:hypothetical protein